MLQPKRTKFRKQHKGRIHGEAKGGFELNFGSYALKATEPERVTARQIEAARRAYDDWWQALGWVREGLIASGMLREVEVTAAMPRARPWDQRPSRQG